MCQSPANVPRPYRFTELSACSVWLTVCILVNDLCIIIPHHTNTIVKYALHLQQQHLLFFVHIVCTIIISEEMQTKCHSMNTQCHTVLSQVQGLKIMSNCSVIGTWALNHFSLQRSVALFVLSQNVILIIGIGRARLVGRE